jgi:hypothetical protein
LANRILLIFILKTPVLLVMGFAIEMSLKWLSKMDLQESGS